MFFVRNKTTEARHLIGDVLDSVSSPLVVLQAGKCDVLFANAAARRALWRDGEKAQCAALDEDLREKLCPRCPNGEDDCPGDKPPYVKGRDDRWYTFEARDTSWLEGTQAVMLSFRDANQEQVAARKIYQMAYTDSLTGLPNREKLHEDFARLWEKNGDSHYGVVALFDMDLFKQVNDTYGHSTGNLLLKRLAQHLEMTPGFQGRLYRLGGDEFVLFFTAEKDSFPCEQDMRSHYEKLLDSAFYSYTMPNIELCCTISMGIAYAPAHGAALSELLRKADIALYKAKNNGRNRMVIFEEWYDTARRFSDYYINIRPVLTETGHTWGYELTDNTGGAEGSPRTLNLNMKEVNLAIEAISPRDLEADHRYFIGYSHRLSSPAVLAHLPREKFIIRLPDRCEGVPLHVCRELRELGYQLAVNWGPETPGELVELAQFLRVAAGDFPGNLPKPGLYPDKMLIAADIGAEQDHKRAIAAGFHLYQGRFFNRPVVVKTGKDIEPLKLNYFRLLALVCTGNAVDFRQVSDIVSADIALTYRLLRLLNSAAAGVGNRISSVSMAVTYMGEDSIKKWIALLALRGLTADKPMEIIRVSLIRARFGELLAPHISPYWDVNQVFLAGMFSLLHIALGTTREALLDELSLAEEIRDSLLTDTGIYAGLLAFFSHYEYSNWEEVTRFSHRHKLDCTLVYGHYIAAVKWFNELARSEADELIPLVDRARPQKMNP